MRKIEVKNNLNNYNILLGCDTLSYFLESFNFPKKVLLVSHPDIFNKYKDLFSNKSFDILLLDSGEESKDFDSFLKVSKFLLEKEYDKSDLIIGFGGGVILDLCGFVSSTYKRGINYIMIPTTLLSVVDASIGGKNAINLDGIKNVLGSYYMPNMIIDDFNFLESLSDKEIISGLMEILKAGIIGDKEIIEILKDNNLKSIRNNIFLMEELIVKAINVKKKIVEIDPYEENERRVLNLGHTIGHAVEAINFGKITHGEAIALGMIPFLGDDIKEEVVSIIKKYINKTNINLDKDYHFFFPLA